MNSSESAEAAPALPKAAQSFELDGAVRSLPASGCPVEGA
jgi:hypothetical protein